MRYTWDPEKDALNRRKHGLSLKEGIPALEDPHRESWVDDRLDYGEERVITLGHGRQKILCVVSASRQEGHTRIISVRRARNNEIEGYLLGRS